jgi:hypothetical protein
MRLREWFQYSDRESPPYNPTVGTEITTERLWQKKTSEINSSDWRLEEFVIHSFLVPVNQLNAAAANIVSLSSSVFELGWNSDDGFSFGDNARYADIQLFPLALCVRHPVTHEFIHRLSREFMIYHALLKRNQSQYFHPLDNILVAETTLDSRGVFDPTPRTVIHRDYLRDFLAAVDMGLLICITADRFANAPTERELELEQMKDEQIGEYTWLSTSIHTPEHTGHSYFRGRSILRRNLIIEPYDKPKYERNPWPYYGERDLAGGELPLFIVSNEGDKRSLSNPTSLGSYGYLYFRPDVLQRYLQIPGYRVFFHMRSWGAASLPGDRGTIDVGINSQGLVNAFAPDIADLDVAEQSYWASFSSLPSGEVCEEMFQTRMQQRPPHSPGITELIGNARSQLNAVFLNRFSGDLFNDLEPTPQDQGKLSVGPLTNQFAEVLELAKILYGWVIETMKLEPLRATLSVLGGSADTNLRQIKLLERILMANGRDESQARSITAPLVGLNELRISSAHIGNRELEPSFQLLGAPTPETPRKAWDLCVDSVVESLSSIATILQA